MITVTAAEFQKRFGRYREAAQRQPVAVTSHGRDSVVLVSATEYERLKRQDREALYVSELDGEDLKAIAEAEAPEDSARFDQELTP